MLLLPWILPQVQLDNHTVSWSVCLVGVIRVLLLQQPVDLVHTLKTVKGLLLLVPPRTPRSSGYDVYAHVVYVVICYMSPWWNVVDVVERGVTALHTSSRSIIYKSETTTTFSRCFNFENIIQIFVFNDVLKKTKHDLMFCLVAGYTQSLSLQSSA
jgi:hypothetical protein